MVGLAVICLERLLSKMILWVPCLFLFLMDVNVFVSACFLLLECYFYLFVCACCIVLVACAVCWMESK